MSIKKLIILFFTLFVFNISCTDHDISTGNKCKFTGTTYHVVSDSFTTRTIVDHDSELIKNDKGLLEQYTSYYTDALIDTLNESEIRTISDTHKYLYQYDNEGYLIKLIHTSTTLNKGSDKATFFYDTYPSYINGSINVTETTQFQYQEGFLYSENKQVDIIFNSEKTTPTTNTIHQKMTYIYERDANGIITKMTQRNQDGGTETSNFTNGKLVSKVNIANGKIINTTLYNAMEKIESSITPDSQLKYKYDDKGNLLKFESYFKNNLLIAYDYTYDNNPNPELLNNSSFKGILDTYRFQILLATEGVNNVTSRKFTNTGTESTFEDKYIYELNSKGYPEKSTVVSSSGANTTTTYKYQDCQ